jgi:hypothetical protein
MLKFFGNKHGHVRDGLDILTDDWTVVDMETRASNE